MPEEEKTLLTFWSLPWVIEVSRESKSGCDSLVIMAKSFGWKILPAVSCSDGLDEFWSSVIYVNFPPCYKRSEFRIVWTIPPCCLFLSSGGSWHIVWEMRWRDASQHDKLEFNRVTKNCLFSSLCSFWFQCFFKLRKEKENFLIIEYKILFYSIEYEKVFYYRIQKSILDL